MAKKQSQTADFEIKKSSEELTDQELKNLGGGFTIGLCDKKCCFDCPSD